MGWTSLDDLNVLSFTTFGTLRITLFEVTPLVCFLGSRFIGRVCILSTFFPERFWLLFLTISLILPLSETGHDKTWLFLIFLCISFNRGRTTCWSSLFFPLGESSLILWLETDFLSLSFPTTLGRNLLIFDVYWAACKIGFSRFLAVLPRSGEKEQKGPDQGGVGRGKSYSKVDLSLVLVNLRLHAQALGTFLIHLAPGVLSRLVSKVLLWIC